MRIHADCCTSESEVVAAAILRGGMELWCESGSQAYLQVWSKGIDVLSDSDVWSLQKVLSVE